MDKLLSRTGPWFRLWITSYLDWQPSQWNQAPPQAIALEVAEDTVYSADEAALFLEGFNTSMLEHHQPIWAVAVPVTLRYEGDAHVGMPISGQRFEIGSATQVSREVAATMTPHGANLSAGVDSASCRQ